MMFYEELLNCLQEVLRANGLSQNVTYAPVTLYNDYLIASQAIYAYTPTATFPFLVNLLITDEEMENETQNFTAFSSIIPDASGQKHYVIVCSPILLKLPHYIRIATLIHECIHLISDFDRPWIFIPPEIKEGITEVCSREIQNEMRKRFPNYFPRVFLCSNYEYYTKTVDQAIKGAKIPYKKAIKNFLNKNNNFQYLIANFPDLLDA